MLDTLHGWFAYVLMNNTTTSLIFTIVLMAIVLIIIRMQFVNDTFDIRDVICSWDAKSKKQIVSTNKTLLTSCFLVSSYYLVEHPTEAAFGAYLLAWVGNGGIAAWQKSKAVKPESVIK
jgi:hypothetical protein